jgi:hypothetical protein
MRRVLAAALAKLAELKPAGGRLLVLCGRVVALFARAALQCNYFPHKLEPFFKLPELPGLPNSGKSSLSDSF